MNLKKHVCQRQSISAKDRGQVEWAAGLFFLLLLGILAYTQIWLAAWRAASDYLEDALAAANLASALIDVEEYGRTHKVLIADASDAYAIYLDAVQGNLGLDGEWECANQGLIAGPVEIVDYIVYNVEDGRVDAVRVGRDGQEIQIASGVGGIVRTPNGVAVEHTGVYSEIRFLVKGFPGMTIQAHKGKLVDIVAEEGEKR
ncbi:MAG: hypothetical protein NC399_06010 [Muribaculum sp.]|nr:hypothetical protein [Muribaculum sp.]